MARKSHAPSGRRLMRRDQDRGRLRRKLISLFGQDEDFRSAVTDDLRTRWHKLSLPDDHPGRSWFGAVREAARDEPPNSELGQYVAAVEDFVSMELLLNHDERVAEWFCDYVHAMVSPPDSFLKYVRNTYPADRQNHILDDMVFRLPTGRWDGAEPPVEVVSDWAFMTIQVTPEGAFVRIPDRDPVTVSCYPEWGNFQRWNELKKQARKALDRELTRLRKEFTRRHKGSFHYRKALAREDTVLLPALFAHLNHGAPLPSGVSRKSFERLADRIGIDLPRGRTGPRQKLSP